MLYTSALEVSYACLARHNFRVLVPGAGLGRLAWDVAAMGMLQSVLALCPEINITIAQALHVKGTSFHITCSCPRSSS